MSPELLHLFSHGTCWHGPLRIFKRCVEQTILQSPVTIFMSKVMMVRRQSKKMAVLINLFCEMYAAMSCCRYEGHTKITNCFHKVKRHLWKMSRSLETSYIIVAHVVYDIEDQNEILWRLILPWGFVAFLIIALSCLIASRGDWTLNIFPQWDKGDNRVQALWRNWIGTFEAQFYDNKF